MGARIRHVLETFWKEAHYEHGYELMYTPHVGRALLWQTSGHLDFYREGMYANMEIDGDPYYVKPMNCPFHIMIYKTRPRSYRELPARWAELGTVYRYEKAGVLHGLMRVRCFTQDDGHMFLARDQIRDEIVRIVNIIDGMYNLFGFKYHVELSTRPDNSMGSDEDWEIKPSATTTCGRRPCTPLRTPSRRKASIAKWMKAAAPSTARRST